MSVKAGGRLKPHFAEIQAHDDVSDDFFALFQDPGRIDSCAYFEPPELTLEEAQIAAKIDLNLDLRPDLKPGMTRVGHRLRLGHHDEASHREGPSTSSA